MLYWRLARSPGAQGSTIACWFIFIHMQCKIVKPLLLVKKFMHSLFLKLSLVNRKLWVPDCFIPLLSPCWRNMEKKLYCWGKIEAGWLMWWRTGKVQVKWITKPWRGRACRCLDTAARDTTVNINGLVCMQVQLFCPLCIVSPPVFFYFFLCLCPSFITFASILFLFLLSYSTPSSSFLYL